MLLSVMLHLVFSYCGLWFWTYFSS